MAMEKRRFAHIIRCLFLSGVMSFLVGCSSELAIQADHASQPKEGSMSLAYKTETESETIPTIDAATPPIIETASFGLG
ncbi:MAG: hypothetical protein JSW04_13985 [Desulfobacterales bacterium]|nr:MAG: hypothetical protein JSW04_13985 [Desulfobacterales bacterium]